MAETGIMRMYKGGAERVSAAGRVEADGTVRINCRGEWLPVVLLAECEARGLDPAEVQRAAAPAECLGRLGRNAGDVVLLRNADWPSYREWEDAERNGDTRPRRSEPLGPEPAPRRGVTGAEADIEANYPGGYAAYLRDGRRGSAAVDEAAAVESGRWTGGSAAD